MMPVGRRTQWLTRVCGVCGKRFEVRPSHHHRKYCSRICADEGRKKRKGVCCVHCGRGFEVVLCVYKRDGGKYCSEKCYLASVKKDWVSKICPVCEEQFKVTPARKDTARFCSVKCANKGLSLDRRGENNPAWIGGKTKIVCEVCGKERLLFPCLAKEQRFCSQECKGIWWAQQQGGESNTCWRNAKLLRICKTCGGEFEAYVYEGFPKIYCSPECYQKTLGGPNSPSWRGGKSFEPYPPTFNKEFKEKIRQRDNYKCAICWLFGKDVHHINYIKEDTVPENCITLCKSCHVVTNFNREYWQIALGNLQQIRLGAQPC
jgi:hypothetical protein